jgi:hypothetical protein
MQSQHHYYEMQVQHAPSVPEWAHVRAFFVNTTLFPEVVETMNGNVQRVVVMPKHQAMTSSVWYGNVNWLSSKGGQAKQRAPLAFFWIQRNVSVLVELAPSSVPAFLPSVQLLRSERYHVQDTLDGVILMDGDRRLKPQTFEYYLDGFCYSRHIHVSVGHVVLEYFCASDSSKGFYVYLVMDAHTRVWHKQQTYTAPNGLFNNFPVFSPCGKYVLFFRSQYEFVVCRVGSSSSHSIVRQFFHDMKTSYVVTCGTLFCVVDNVKRVRIWCDPVNSSSLQLIGVCEDTQTRLADMRGWNYVRSTTASLDTFPMARTGAPRL